MSTLKAADCVEYLADVVRLPIGDSWITINGKDDLKLIGVLERLELRSLEQLHAQYSTNFVELVKGVLLLLPLCNNGPEARSKSDHMVEELIREEDWGFARNVLLKYLGDRFGFMMHLSGSCGIKIVHPFSEESIGISSTSWNSIGGSFSTWMGEIGLEKLLDDWQAIERHQEDEFSLEELIHKGITSSIYKCQLRGDLRAAKVFKVDELSEKQRQSCLRELHLMRGLFSAKEHEGVVKYYGYHFSNTNPRRLIVFMTLASGSLRRWRAPGLSISMDDIFSSVRHILVGLSYLHRSKVVHRDIKCANVLVLTDEQGTINKSYISDLGLSEWLTTDRVCSSKSVGSARWMAPEVHRSETADWRSDIWSFGMLLVELLTGQLPYHNLMVLDVPAEIAKGKLPNLPWMLPHQASPEDTSRFQKLTSMCLLCLKSDSQDRPTVESLLVVLESKENATRPQ